MFWLVINVILKGQQNKIGTKQEQMINKHKYIWEDLFPVKDIEGEHMLEICIECKEKRVKK